MNVSRKFAISTIAAASAALLFMSTARRTAASGSRIGLFWPLAGPIFWSDLIDRS